MMKMCKSCLCQMKSCAFWPTLPLRLALAASMIFHGYDKIFGPKGIAGFVGMLSGAGFPMAEFFAWAVALLELVGGVMLIFAVLTPIISGLFAVQFVVAAFVKMNVMNTGFNFMNMGWEFDLVLVGAFVTLAMFFGKGCMDEKKKK